MSNSQIYSPVSSETARDSYQIEEGKASGLDSENAPFLDAESGSRPLHASLIRKYGRLAFEIFLVLVNLGLVAWIIIQSGTPMSLLQRQRECGKLLGQWLPGWENGIEYEVQRFKGSFYLQSEYTGYGPEVDAAWKNITDGGAIGITKEQWEDVNSVGEYPVLLDKDYGTGKYLASFDVFHQLHCVDLLRKSTHREYYNEHEGSFAGAPEEVVAGHLEHCVEILRQTLMCHGDITLLTYNWVKGRQMPYPNFNTVHTCKKWDALIEWKNTLDVTGHWVNGSLVEDFQPPLKPDDAEGLKIHP